MSPRRRLLRFSLPFSKLLLNRRRCPSVTFHHPHRRASLPLPLPSANTDTVTLPHCTSTSTTTKIKMSSDEAYGSFLEQANQPSTSKKASTATQSSSSQKNSSLSTKAVDTDIPPALQNVKNAYYTSEADEPWETVSLKWEGGNMPSESPSATFPHLPTAP